MKCAAAIAALPPWTIKRRNDIALLRCFRVFLYSCQEATVRPGISSFFFFFSRFPFCLPNVRPENVATYTCPLVREVLPRSSQLS